MAEAVRYASDYDVRQAVSESLRVDPSVDYGDQVLVSKHAVGISTESIDLAKTRIAQALQDVLAEG